MSDRETRKANVVEALNKARSMELHAIHQYMNQHYNLDDMDYGELAANMKLIAIDELRNVRRAHQRTRRRAYFRSCREGGQGAGSQSDLQ